jgi:hypothetical protein
MFMPNKFKHNPDPLSQQSTQTASSMPFIPNKNKELPNHFSGSLSPTHIMQLQRIIGNRAVSQLIKSQPIQSNVLQLRKIHAAEIINEDYFKVKVDARKQYFKDLQTALVHPKNCLLLFKGSLERFMHDIEMQPSDDNPLIQALRGIERLIVDLDNNPTEARWNAYKQREAVIALLEEETLVKQSYQHEKAGILTKIRKIRRDTVGKREFILTQLGDNLDWLTPDQATAVETLKRIKTEVDQLIDAATTAGDWTDYENLANQLSAYQKQAEDATNVPFESALKTGYKDAGAEEPQPKLANNYYSQHIIDRHSRSSTAANAGKFASDSFAVIKGWIDTTRNNGALTGPLFDDDGGHPQGRFEIIHDHGVNRGVNINGAFSSVIKIIISRSGKTVITAYPI